MASSLRTNNPTGGSTRPSGGPSPQQQQQRPTHPPHHRAPAAGGDRRPGARGVGGGGGDDGLLQMADAQWLDFAEPGFDPSEYAEGFFLTHSEAEADERCAELMVRGSVQWVAWPIDRFTRVPFDSTHRRTD